MGAALKAQQSECDALQYATFFARYHRTLDVCQSVLIIVLGQGFQITRVLSTAFCQGAGGGLTGGLASFPCEATENQQMLWIFGRTPWLSWHLATEYHWLELTWTIAIEFIILLGAITQARWFVHGGRSLLYASMRPGIVALIFLQLLLAPVNPILLATADVCYLGSKGLLFLIFDIICQGFPWAAHVRVTCFNWLLLTLYNVTYHWKYGGTWGSVAVEAAVHLLVGVGFPVLASRLRHQSVAAKYQAFLQQQEQGKPQATKAAAPKEFGPLDADAPSTSAAAQPSSGNTAAEANATASAGCSTVAGLGGGGSGSGASGSGETLLEGAELARPVRVRKALYKGVTRVRCVNIKIQHHDAYQQRDTIASVVTSRLEALCTPQGQAAAAPPIIRTLALPGCLHLLMSITQPAGPPANNCGCPPLPPPLEELCCSDIAEHIFEALPPDCRASGVTVQVGATACHFSTGGDASTADGGSKQLQPVDLTHLQLAPPCVSSGLPGPQAIQVQVPAAVQAAGSKLVAVVSVGGRQQHCEVVVEAMRGPGCWCRCMPASLQQCRSSSQQWWGTRCSCELGCLRAVVCVNGDAWGACLNLAHSRQWGTRCSRELGHSSGCLRRHA